METGYIIMCVFLVIFGILGLVKIIMDTYTQGKKEILDKMLKNGDIDKDIYFKYLSD